MKKTILIVCALLTLACKGEIMKKLMCVIAIGVFALTAVYRPAYADPGIGDITPINDGLEAGEEVIFTIDFTDSNGVDNLKRCDLLINTRFSWENGFYSAYKVNSDEIILRNNDNTAWLGYYSPGSANIIGEDDDDNRYASIDCTKFEVLRPDANTLRIKWPVKFKEGAIGDDHVVYLYAKSKRNLNTGWHLAGSWSVYEALVTMSRKIRFQGRLSDTQGSSQDDIFNVTFRLYDADKDGSPLWEELQQGVSIEEGILDVELGSVTPLDCAFDKQYWLSVEIDSDGEMIPRFKLNAVPYAIKAEQ